MAMTTASALRRLAGVKRSRGSGPSVITLRMVSPTRSHSRRLSSLSAGAEELPGRQKPSVSMTIAMVLAVYMPPQAPAPGQALRTMARWRPSSMLPRTSSP